MNLQRTSSTVLFAALSLTGCADRFASVHPDGFRGRARVAVVAFDAFDWNAGVLAVGNAPEIHDQLASGFQAFVTDLSHAGLDVAAQPVVSSCGGDLAVICGAISAAELRPVNLSSPIARALAASLASDIVVEVHLLPDPHPDGFWSRVAAGNDATPEPTLFVRAFDSKGTQIWEDQEVLGQPLTFDRARRDRSYQAGVTSAVDTIVNRLHVRLRS